jgi:hypothetical protein
MVAEVAIGPVDPVDEIAGAATVPGFSPGVGDRREP